MARNSILLQATSCSAPELSANLVNFLSAALHLEPVAPSSSAMDSDGLTEAATPRHRYERSASSQNCLVSGNMGQDQGCTALSGPSPWVWNVGFGFGFGGEHQGR